jgi:glycosyltransferase involved in cell wall biosynthesis
VIASHVGGLPELLTHDESALLFDPEQSDALRTAIDRLRIDTTLRARLSAAARRRAEHHAWPAIARRIEPLLTGH